MSVNISLKVKIIKLPHGIHLNLPQYATEGSSGLDLYAAIPNSLTIKAKSSLLIPTGIAINLPNGYEAQVRSRSGLAAKNCIMILNSPGTIDSDYRGEIQLILFNHSNNDFIIEPGARMAQLIVSKYERITWDEVEKLEESVRGSSGIGSTGV